MATAPAAHVDVDPITTRKLREFGSRRRRLIVLRGVCAAVISLIAVMSLIALIDYVVILTDEVRWILSLAGYLAVGVVVWRTCVRMIMHIPSERELARLVESTEPTLHEDLISAVELGAPESDARYDSPVFRQLLQDDVAGRMRNLDIESHLPWALVRRWIQVAVVVLGVCLILLALPGGRFRLPLMRAMLPGANLDRYSQVQVQVLAPQPADKTVPQSEPIQVLVQLNGPDTERVVLEAFHPDKGRQRVRMNPRGQRQFAVHVDVGRDPVQYRILAGDAVTRRYTITPFPRPYVTAFRKTYQYPDYTRLDAKTVTETDGDLSAFEKTTVALQLDTDQPVESGELRIDLGGQKVTVPLKVDAQKRLTADVPIDRSGTYQVHLVSARTDFVNKFSPTYEISAQADLVPRVEIIEPAKSVLLPPDEIVGLRGRAEDDLGLAKIEQWIRVNNRRPVYVPLAEEAGTERLVARNWDLLPLKLKPGDRVITKLEAVDLKGNRATSQPLQVTVTAPGFDARRHAQLQAKLDVLAQINRLGNQTAESAASASEAINQIRKTHDLDLRAQQYLTNAIASAQTLAEQSEQSLAFVAAALPRVGKGSDAHDIMLAARLVAQTQHVHALLAGARMAEASRTIDPDARGRELDEARGHFDRARSAMDTARRQLGTIVSADVTAAVTNDLRALTDEQDKLLGSTAKPLGDDELTWQRLGRRESVAMAQVELIEQILGDAVRHLDRNDGRELERFVKVLDRQSKGLRKALEAETYDRKLLEPAKQFHGALRDAHRQVKQRHRSHAKQAIQARREMYARAGSAREATARLRDRVQRLVQKQIEFARFVDQNPGGVELDRRRQQIERETRTILELAWPAAAESIKALAKIEESRADADSRFAADLGLTGGALEAIREQYVGTDGVDPRPQRASEKLAILAASLGRLEAAHDVVEIASTSLDLTRQEKWRRLRVASHTHHPRQWDFASDRMPVVAGDFNAVGFPATATQLLASIPKRPHGQAVGAEMNGRRQQVRQTANVIKPLGLVNADLAEVLRLIRPDLAEARKSMADLAPTLAQLMRRVAREVRAQEAKTKEVAEQAPEAEARKTREQAVRLQEDQLEVRKEVGDVLDALRREANVQDVLTEEGRQRARDADDAVAILKEPAGRAENALADALAAQLAQEQSRHLAEAAAEEGKLADSLLKLAAHFEKRDAGSEVAESRQELRRAEKELGIDDQLDKQFDQAKRLEELAKADPAEALAELEAELKRNREMQKELDQLTQDTVAQAQADLEKAAAGEKAVEAALEKAEQGQEDAAKSIAEQISEIGEKAKALAGEEVAEATKAAAAGKAPEAAQEAAEAGKQLEQAAAEAKQIANASDALDKLAEDTAQLAENLGEAAEQLGEAAEAAGEAAGENPEGGEPATPEAAQAQANAEQAAEAAAKQAEAAANQAAQSAEAAEKASAQVQAKPEGNQAAEAAEQSAQSAKQSAEAAQQASEAAQQAAEAAAKSPQSDKAQSAAEQAAAEAQEAAGSAQEAAAAAQEAAAAAPEGSEQTAAAQAAAEQAAQSAEQAAAAADQAAAAAEAARTPAQNAAAAQEQAAAAAQEAGELAEQAGALAEALEQQAAAAEQAVAEGGAQQEALGEAAEQAAADVGRAARHEQRLGNAEAAEALGEVAEAAAGAAQEAGQEFAEAQAPAEPGAAAEAAGEAGEAFGEAAEALGELLAQAGEAGEPSEGAAAEGSPSEGSPSEGSPSEGSPSEGSPSEGSPSEGSPSEGSPSEGSPSEGSPSEGSPSEGSPSEGSPSEGSPSPGSPSPGSPSPGSPSESSPFAGEAAEALAQALDQLDQQLFDSPSSGEAGTAAESLAQAAAAASTPGSPSPGSPSPGSPSPGSPSPGSPSPGSPSPGSPSPGSPSAASEAIAAAAAAHAQAMAGARSQTPGQTPKGEGFSEGGAGVAVVAGDLPYAELSATERQLREAADWSKLPPKLARDLMQGRRQSVAGPYRRMVETYYRVIAEKAKEKKKP